MSARRSSAGQRAVMIGVGPVEALQRPRAELRGGDEAGLAEQPRARPCPCPRPCPGRHGGNGACRGRPEVAGRLARVPPSGRGRPDHAGRARRDRGAPARTPRGRSGHYGRRRAVRTCASASRRGALHLLAALLADRLGLFASEAAVMIGVEPREGGVAALDHVGAGDVAAPRPVRTGAPVAARQRRRQGQSTQRRSG